MVDQVFAFAPKLIAGQQASHIGGRGLQQIAEAIQLQDVTVEDSDGDVYLHGRVGQVG